jgi:DNA helicase HerA-like ATPase
VPEAVVQIPLRMMNRHGLVAGATGTGKTVTLQTIAEQLSAAGVAVFAADMKGDVSGLAVPGEPGGPAEKRMTELGLPFAPAGHPVEYLSLGGLGPGVPVRATVTDFGPQLLAKILESNQTQEESLALVFHYADEKGLPLLDLSDLRALLTFLESDAGKDELDGIGGLASSTVGVLLRALVGLEDGGGTEFFGEPQLDVADLLRTKSDGRGVISVLELPAVQDKPRLFSTALMWLLAELFEQLPEAGDLDKPKLVFFFDEAHLLFADATDAFLESVTQTVRLIRSKGVGVFFVTQVPDDVPASVLGQLGNRVQHALRAFTPDDAKALRAAASTYPKSGFYDVEELLTSMGSARPRSPPCPTRASPRRSSTRACARPCRASARPRTWTPPPRPRRCSPSTARASRPRARASSWRRGWSGPPSTPSPSRLESGARPSDVGLLRRRRPAAWTRWATSLPRARARRFSARCCVGSSGC